MSERLLLVAIENETDIVLARQRTRQISALLGFDAQDQTRITTALSEIARNAVEYGKGGRIEYWLEGDTAPQRFAILVQDRGPGIADVQAILNGSHRSAMGMGIGILGARRLMDEFELDSARGGGTRVRLSKRLPKRTVITPGDLKKIAAVLAKHEGIDPLAEIRRQNREMMVQLEELSERQEELNQLNEELQDTNRGVVALYAELNDRADHLRHADELKSRFLSNMTHEFRTPLNSILALSRLLLSRTDGALTPEQDKQVNFIRKAAENLTELVNDLLDLAKVEAGKTVVTRSEFVARDLFSTLRGMLRPLLVGESVALIFEDPTDLPPLQTDEGKVSQILRNFISNALKFTERGEVRVSAGYDSESDTVSFHIRDTGIGIAEKDLDLIWQEFAQIQNPIQTRVKGTGLGLPLSKKLAELLRGSVSVESAPGQGSIFTLVIPRVYRVRSDAIDDATKWTLDSARIPVLAIEDNPADALTYERFLKESRYQVIPARSVAQAQRVLEHLTPAAMIFDIMLEGEETWHLLLETKHREKTQTIPIIVVSSTQDERKARDLGADDYLNKPVDPTRLITSLDNLTGGSSITKVLLVDDEEISRYLVRQLLPRGVFDLREAATAIDGLERAHDERPDVILLDLNMKPMDGFEFLDRLSAKAGMPPAIVITSMVLDSEQKRRLTTASQIVPKSDLTSDTLIAAIRRTVAAKEKPAS